MTKDILLEAKHIHHQFKNNDSSSKILEDVSLKIKKAEIMSISGVSGAGKSTLMFILSGLLNPCSGDVYFEEHQLYQLSDSKRFKLIGKHIGFLFQDYQLLNDFTVVENIAFSLELAGQKPNHDEINTRLAQTQLSHRAKHYPSELSGGEKQRVALLRALIKKPKLLFCDEPTGNLDDTNATIITNLIQEYHQQFGLSVVIVSHQDAIKKLASTHYKIKNKSLVKT